MNIQEGDIILEIGPGEGVLTEWLLKSSAKKLIAVEVDERCYHLLHKHWNNEPKLQLIHADFLSFDIVPLISDNNKLRIVGNLPYSISSPILFKILDISKWIKDVTVMLQKEVAERIAASPNSKAYGIPSVLTQMKADANIRLYVSRRHFFPQPKVDSAIIHLNFLEKSRYDIPENFFRKIVEGEWGRIEEITLTYVVVKIWDQRRLILPITHFIEKPFQNWTRTSAEILGTVFIYTDYSFPVETLREELHNILQKQPPWDKQVWNLVVTNTTEQTMELRALMSAEDASKAWTLRCAGENDHILAEKLF